MHHSDRAVQYLSIRYTERLAQAGIEPSVGGTGDSYDNALAETVIGSFKTEEIHRRGPWPRQTPWAPPLLLRLYPCLPEKRTFHLLSGADRSCAPYMARYGRDTGP